MFFVYVCFFLLNLFYILFLLDTESSKLIDQAHQKSDEFKEEKAIYHANQINEHAHVEETVKDDFLTRNTHTHGEAGDIQVVYKFTFFSPSFRIAF